MSAEPIVVEETYPVDREIVWRAVTDPEQMRRWYFETMEDFRPEVGFETRFDVDAGERVFGHHWKVTRVQPGRSITYEWRYDGYPGLGMTEWRLSDTDGGTKLTLVCTGIESFPRDVPELTRESCENGWEFFLRERLAAYLGEE